MLSVPDTTEQQHRLPVARWQNTTPSKLTCANYPVIQPDSHLQRSTVDHIKSVTDQTSEHRAAAPLQ
ncbi:hypothetical protein SAMN05216466_103309 [Paraburkholderia phenazinium]|uniref:Uncharacterized protein n=1 Tax=Paraburkholderia phenazinium TaxID=60549 RepID=A0A1G7U547_9BURK|nr:hypothetical protein SAMN05216466_103309 [Paraburkholderia phenazinium]